MKASVFMAMRNALISELHDIDDEISRAVKYKASTRAFERTKALFAERSKIRRRLADFGIEVDDHPAVRAHIKK